jgi:hypothetical protein
MEPENLDQKLEEIKNLEQENHEMIKSIQRSMFWGRVFGIVRWVIIIGGTVGVFYYFQPIIDQLWATYREILQTLGSNPV